MDRGRQDEAGRQAKVVDDRLDALSRAVANWTLVKVAPAHDKAPLFAERNVIGLIRVAVRSGASVGEVAGVTGMSRSWVRSKLGPVRDSADFGRPRHQQSSK